MPAMSSGVESSLSVFECHDRVVERGRAYGLRVETTAAAVDQGKVTRDRRADDRERARVVDAAARGCGVAGDRAVGDRGRASGAVVNGSARYG